MITLQLTQQEAEALRTLLDAGVRAGGLQAAMFAVPLMHKLLIAAQEQAAAQQAKPEEAT